MQISPKQDLTEEEKAQITAEFSLEAAEPAAAQPAPDQQAFIYLYFIYDLKKQIISVFYVCKNSTIHYTEFLF
jgi:hypothetical protein